MPAAALVTNAVFIVSTLFAPSNSIPVADAAPAAIVVTATNSAAAVPVANAVFVANNLYVSGEGFAAPVAESAKEEAEAPESGSAMTDAVFLLLFITLTAIMALVPFLFKRFGIPSVISLLVVGMLIGDTGIGVNLIPRLSHAIGFLGLPGTDPDATSATFTVFIDKLGSLGLMFLMALAGMEADFKLIKSCRRPVALMSGMTFLLPAMGGFLLYRHYFPNALPGQLLYASLFASHSVGIVFPVIRELKLSKSRFGASVLIATVITDVSSIILLAVAVQLFRQTTSTDHMVLSHSLSILDHNAGLLGNSFMPVFLGIVLLYMSIMIFLLHRVGKWFVRHLPPSEDLMVTVMLLVILLSAFLGELFGINFIVGSFIAGLGLSRVVRDQEMLIFRRFESIGYGFLIPFLFVSIGMKTDFTAFLQPGSLNIVLLTITILVGTKIASGYFAMRLSGFHDRAGLAAGLMTVPQLSATLTAAAIGKGLGILDEQFFNAIIILSIVTTLPIPNLVRGVIYHGSKRHLAEELGEDFKVPDVVTDTDLL